jgi:hypothetical protein
MYPIPNGFWYLARNIFLPYLSMNNQNSQLTLHTDSHISDIGALRRGGKENIARQIQNTARQISETVRNRTHVHTNFFLRMTDTMTSQNIDPSSWDTLYTYASNPTFSARYLQQKQRIRGNADGGPTWKFRQQ